jgi:YHS domain-containing protein
MIRLLLLALLFFLAYTAYNAFVRSLPGRKTLPKDKSREGEEMVRDSQCGTFVPRSMALEKSIQGEKHFFCSAKCRDIFTGKKG